MSSTHDPLPFSIEWLAEVAREKRPPTVCPRGHLWSKDSCFMPIRFAPGLKAIICEPVDHPQEAK